MAYDEDEDFEDEKPSRSKSPGRRRRGSGRRGARKEREHVIEDVVQTMLADAAPVLPGQIFPVLPGNNGAHLEDTIEQALWKSAGKLSIAAGWLGMTRRALEARVGDSDRLQLVISEIEELGLDIAEMQLDALVLTGSDKAIAFKLKTKGKRRGWAENKGPATGNNLTLDAARELEARMVSAFTLARQMATEAVVAPQQAIQAPQAEPEIIPPGGELTDANF